MGNEQEDAKEKKKHEDFEIPDNLQTKKIYENANNSAEKFVENLKSKLNDDEKIELKHQNLIFELKIIAYRMRRYMHLTEGFEEKRVWLGEKLTKINDDMKSSRDGLSFWEGGKLTQPEIAGKLLEFIGKAALSFVTIGSISIIFSPKDVMTIQGSANTNASEIFQNLSFAFWFAVLAGISLVELTSASVYNWFTSEEHLLKSYDSSTNNDTKSDKNLFFRRFFSWIRPFHLVLLFILLAEGLMGASILLPIIVQGLKNGGGKLPDGKSGLAPPEFWHIFIAVAVFALVNITFAISKAKRDNFIVGKKTEFHKYVQLTERIREEMNFCDTQIHTANEKFEKYFTVFRAMMAQHEHVKSKKKGLI